MDRLGAVQACDVAGDSGDWLPARAVPGAADRLAALSACGLRGTVPDNDFATVVGLAADMFAAPYAALILTVGDRQTWIAPHGTDLRSAPLAGSICAALLTSASALAFGGGLLVPELPAVRSGVGIRVRGPGGVPIGALCLFDIVDRPAGGLAPGERRQLDRLAQLIEDRIEQRRAAIVRQRDDELLRLAQGMARVGTFYTDMVDEAVCSPEYYRQLGLQPDTPDIGRRWRECVHPDDTDRVFASINALVEHGGSFECDYRIVRADTGEVRWISTRTLIAVDADTGAICVTGANIDVTDRVRAWQAVEESRNLLRSVIDQSSDAIFVKDRESRFVLASAGCATTLGWSPEETVGKRTEEVFPEVSDMLVAHDRAIMASGTGETFESMRLIRGEMRVIQTEALPWRRDGVICGIVAISRDITALKQAQAAAEDSRDLLRSVIDQSSDAIFVKDRDSRFVLASAQCAETIGMPVDQIVGRLTHDLFPGETADHIVAMDRERMELGISGFYERETIRNGETRILQSAVGPWVRDGQVAGLITVARDITDNKRIERALRDSEERFRLAAQAIGLGIWDFDAARRRHQASDELLAILGLAPDATPRVGRIRDLIHEEDRPKFYRLIRAVTRGDAGDRFEATLRVQRVSDLQERWIATNGWKTLTDAGDLSRVIVTVRDITEEKTAESRIQWTATHDMLTGLPNRARFQEDLTQSIAGAGDGRIGLLMLDVDHFKQVNDTLGHDAGDALLRSMGVRLCEVLRPGDLVARLGGDEFAVILRDVRDESDVVALVDRLLVRLREPFIHGGRILDCRASIGASLYPDHASTADAMLKNADTALYVAKAAGRGKMMLFRPEMLAEAQRRTTVLRQVATALDENRVMPFYQPKVALSTGELVGFEALMRWCSPGAGVRLPGEISVAFEDLDLANALSDRMFERAIADMRRWLDSGLRFGHVAVNASAAEFRRDDFAERLLARLRAADVPTSCLELEVTETVFLGRGAEYVERALNTLCGAGVRIALDDFGTGYASLSHLKQFPVDTIKIDRSFVRDLEDDADDAAIVRAVLNLGQNLGMKVVAEGVETPAQAAYLWAQGCDFGQGYLFGRPLPAGRIPKLVANWDANRRWKRPGRRAGYTAADTC